jgi:hypothetical protein
MVAERTRRRNHASSPPPAAHTIRAKPPLARGDLIALLLRLRDELNTCLDDLGVRRELSGNRE